MASEKKVRFYDATEDEFRELVKCAVHRNTKRATNFWMAVFDDFCNEKGIVINLKSVEWKNSRVLFVNSTEVFARRAMTSVRSRHTLQPGRLSDATLPSIFNARSISSKLSCLRSSMSSTR